LRKSKSQESLTAISIIVIEHNGFGEVVGKDFKGQKLRLISPDGETEINLGWMKKGFQELG